MMTKAELAQAACQNADPEMFFPKIGYPAKAAKQLCARCPVQQACLQMGLEHDPQEDVGVWGGTSVNERVLMRRLSGGFKTCNRCREDKPHSGFTARSDRPDGLESVCRTCRADDRARRAVA